MQAVDSHNILGVVVVCVGEGPLKDMSEVLGDTACGPSLLLKGTSRGH